MTRYLPLVFSRRLSDRSGSLTGTILLLEVLGMLVGLTSVARWHRIHVIIVKYYMGRMALLSFAIRLRMLFYHYKSPITTLSVPFTSRRLYKFKASGVHSVVGFLRGA